MKNKLSSYAAGVVAHNAGYSLFTNPYDIGADYTEWFEGWSDAHSLATFWTKQFAA